MRRPGRVPGRPRRAHSSGSASARSMAAASAAGSPPGTPSAPSAPSPTISSAPPPRAHTTGRRARHGLRDHPSERLGLDRGVNHDVQRAQDLGDVVPIAGERQRLTQAQLPGEPCERRPRTRRGPPFDRSRCRRPRIGRRDGVAQARRPPARRSPGPSSARALRPSRPAGRSWAIRPRRAARRAALPGAKRSRSIPLAIAWTRPGPGAQASEVRGHGGGVGDHRVRRETGDQRRSNRSGARSRQKSRTCQTIRVFAAAERRGEHVRLVAVAVHDRGERSARPRAEGPAASAPPAHEARGQPERAGSRAAQARPLEPVGTATCSTGTPSRAASASRRPVRPGTRVAAPSVGGPVHAARSRRLRSAPPICAVGFR